MIAWLWARLKALFVWTPPAPLSPEQRAENRMDWALRLLAGGGIAMTLHVAYLSFRLAERGAIWPLFYIVAGELVLIGIVLTTYGYMLGRKGLHIEATREGVKISDGDRA